MTETVARLLGALRREVVAREVEGKSALALVFTRTFDTSVDDLWDAITQPQRLARWFAPISGELVLGGRFQVEGNASGKVVGCDPPRKLSLTWEYGGTTSWVEAHLEPDDKGALLRLEHLYHPDEAFETKYGPGAGGVGWELSIVGLDFHLAGRATTATELESVWLKTDEGRAFVRDASARWGDAAIAAGASEQDARDAAQRTAQFYLGDV